MAQTVKLELPKVPSINVEGGVKSGISAPSMYRTKIPDFSDSLNRLIEGNYSKTAKQSFVNEIVDLAYRAYSPTSSLEERQSVSYVNVNSDLFSKDSSPQDKMSDQMQRLGFQQGGKVFGSDYSTFQPTTASRTPGSDIARQAVTSTIGAAAFGASASDTFQAVSQGIARQALGRDLNTVFNTYNMVEGVKQYGIPNTPIGALGFAAGILNAFSGLSKLSLEDIPGQVTKGFDRLGKAITGFVQDPIGSTKTAIANIGDYMEYGTPTPTISTVKGPYGYTQSMVTGPDGKVTTPGMITSVPIVGTVASLAKGFMGEYYDEYKAEFNSMAEATKVGFTEVTPGIAVSMDFQGSLVGVMDVPGVGAVSLNNEALNAIAAGNFDAGTDLGKLGFQDINFEATEEVQELINDALNKASLSKETLDLFSDEIYGEIAERLSDPLSIEEQIQEGVYGKLDYGMVSPEFPDLTEAFNTAISQRGFSPYTAPISFSIDPAKLEYAQAMSTQGPGGIGTTEYGAGYLDYDDLDEFGNPTLSFESMDKWAEHVDKYGLFGGPTDDKPTQDQTAPGTDTQTDPSGGFADAGPF